MRLSEVAGPGRWCGRGEQDASPTQVIHDCTTVEDSTSMLSKPTTTDDSKKPVIGKSDSRSGNGCFSYTRDYRFDPHGTEQYYERGTSDDSHQVGLAKSGRVTERPRALSRGLSYEADELRYYSPPDGKNLLFIIRDQTVVTVLYAEEYRINMPEGRQCPQCGAFGEVVVSDGCSYCSDKVQQRIQETSA